MGIRNIKFSEGEYYHVYNRGTDKRIIFDDKIDFLRFIMLLYLCNSVENISITEYSRNELPPVINSVINFFNIERKNTLVEIGAYCLMPNHFHLLIREKEDGNISIFMQKLSTAYSKYYNNKNKRTGSLFQGKFKAEHVDNDTYLKYLFAYIHLNPLKLINSKWKEIGLANEQKAKDFLKNYKYSSYLYFVNKVVSDKTGERVLNLKNFPKYFKNFDDFKKDISYWLSFKKE